MSIQFIPKDILIICAELMTGKSIPVIVAIATLPVDQLLAWTMLCMGAASGALFSVYSSRCVVGMTQLGFVNRLLQLCFSLWLSLSLLLSVTRGIHAERGVVLSVIPTFCVVIQALPQRTSTALVAFLLNLGVFYVCMVTVAWSPVQTGLYARRMIASTLAEEADSVGQIVLRALQLFSLAFYACIQHAPTSVYFASEHGVARSDVYASHRHARSAHHTLVVALVSAWIRVCVWSSICFFQDNFLHSILENSHALYRDGSDWFCCSMYMVTLLYSASWTATQLGEQVLPWFVEKGAVELKLLVCILAGAALFRQRNGQLAFITTHVLTVLCIVTTLLTLKTDKVGHKSKLVAI